MTTSPKRRRTPDVSESKRQVRIRKEPQTEVRPLWESLDYNSASAMEKAEAKAVKEADGNDVDWRAAQKEEKKQEERYSSLTFEQKTGKLTSLLTKASAFAEFLGNNTSEARNGEGGFKQPVAMTGGKQKLKLRKYQLQGTEWLNSLCENGMSGILADEMGLGKTIQVIALHAHLQKQVGAYYGLIVAPLSTLPNWEHEFKRWCPSQDVLLYHGSPQERALLRHKHLHFTKPRPKGITNSKLLGQRYLSRKIMEANTMSHKELLAELRRHGLKAPPARGLAGKSAAKKALLTYLEDFKSTGSKRHSIERHMKQSTPIVITSYGMILRDVAHFRQFDWFHLTVDEGHRLKNKDCRLMHELKSMRTEHRLLLTGTPLQNNVTELWSLLHFLRPDIFADCAFFNAWFGWDSRDAEMEKQIEQDTIASDIVSKLHKILNPFMLRRLKRDVTKSLPSKTEIVVYVGMTEGQKELYNALVKDSAQVARQLRAMKTQGGGGGRSTSLLNTLMQLRKCCNHPYLFHDNPETDEHLVQMSGKLVLMDNILKKLFANGHKVLIFSQFTSMLDIIEDYFLLRRWSSRVCRIDGSVKLDDRRIEIDQFNDPESKKSVFLLSTRAGGVGINLASADTVIIFDSDWNPHMDNQAQDRAHRIGQTKDVFVYRFCIEGSVELKILEAANKKRSLERLTMAGNFGGASAKKRQAAKMREMRLETVKEYLQDAVNVSSAQRAGSTGGISKRELETILDRRKILEAKRVAQIAGKKGEAARQLLKGVGYEVVEHQASNLIGKADVFDAQPE